MYKFELDVDKILFVCNLIGVILFTLFVGSNLVPMIWLYLGHVWAIVTAIMLAMSAYFLIYGMLWELATKDEAE